MSYASGTTHYNLPQTIGSDKRDWTDTNQAFSDVDAALYAAAQGAESAASAISSIQSDITTIQGKQSTDEGNITTLQGKVSTLESTVSGQGTEINDVRRDLQDNIESKHESSATSTHAYAIGDTFYYNDVLYKATAAIAIGDTIVPNTNCTGITVMSEIQSGAAAPSAADVSYDNTTSGLTADDVQEAVDELASAVDDIDIRYTVANGAEWSPRGAGTWSPFSTASAIKEFLTFSNRPYSEGGYQVVGGLFISETTRTVIANNTAKADFILAQDLVKDYYLSTDSTLTIAKDGYYIVNEGAPTLYHEDDVISGLNVPATSGFTLIYLGTTNPFA